MDLLALAPLHPFLEGRSHRALWPLVEIVGWTTVVVLIGVFLFDSIQDWVWRRRNRRAGLTAPKTQGDLHIAETSVLRRLFMKRLPPTTKVLTRRGFSPTGGTGADDYSPTGRHSTEPRDRPGGPG